MKVTLYMAMSLNGYIADRDGDEGFLSHENWEKFCSLAREYGNFIVGRKTYEAVRNWSEGYGFDDLEGVRKIVVSRDGGYKLSEGYEVAASPEDALSKLRGFESVLVTGGSSTNTAFLEMDLLDEVVVNVEPVLIGEGVPLFAHGDFAKRLTLVSSEQADHGIITLNYKVQKAT